MELKCKDCGNTDVFKRNITGYVIATEGNHVMLDFSPSANGIKYVEYDQGEGYICADCDSENVEEV